ncbi:MAG: MerC domain-containing protein [Maribacter sp.]|uniref:MerC domain-containing protein n=1 Tax=Maribacter sp. TaxID=1897614 RepID=UPI00329805DD
MKAITKLSDHPNIWGSFASGLCLAHCVATPFLFAAHTGHVQGHHSHPQWWGFIDILFMVISFLAVFWSVRNTSKYSMKVALWISWALLAMTIVNEKLELIGLIEAFIYIPSMALIVLHLYNRKYCQCEKECCASTN